MFSFRNATKVFCHFFSPVLSVISLYRVHGILLVDACATSNIYMQMQAHSVTATASSGEIERRTQKVDACLLSLRSTNARYRTSSPHGVNVDANRNVVSVSKRNKKNMSAKVAYASARFS